ncbi:MAG: replication initiation protein [Proteobacteria bacterium]|nr:replication initiation protein [Pseudomonadota bacterium]
MSVRLGKISFFTIILFLIFIYNGNDWLRQLENNLPSKIVIDGKKSLTIQNAKRLPTQGKNYQTYSRFLSAIGRTHVHERVRDAIIKSYKILETTQPNIIYVYGETGWKNGGNFWPHKTHKNGLYVDFMVPVKKENNPATMWLWALNGWGYYVRFNENGVHDQYLIDFEAIIEHLKALQETCKLFYLKIKIVIFDPALLRLLRKTDLHQKLNSIPFASQKAWFPHDSHYHVEFEIIK